MDKGGSAFGGFIFIALLLALIPAFIAANIASKRDQSTGMAFLLGLVLSWLGLALVYFLMKDESTTVTVSTAPLTRASSTRTTPERIRELQTLRDQGLISEDEYTSRRESILAQV